MFERWSVAVFAMAMCCLSPMASLGIASENNDSWTVLKEFGFVQEQLDKIRSRNSRPLTGADAQPMRDLQAAVGQWEANQFDKILPLSLLDLLADTPNSVCRRVRMIGRVRQCIRIKAQSESADEGDLFQLTIFPDLDGQAIAVKTSAGNRVPYGRFAVTVRASKLPPGESEQSLVDKRIQVDGIHYRFWQYDSVFAHQQDLGGQIGALVLAGPVKVLADRPTALVDDGLMWLLGLLAIGLIAMGWWYGRASFRGDRTYDALPDMLPEDWKVD